MCHDLFQLVEQFKQGAGALMLAEESVGSASFASLETALAQQEPWSDVPVIELGRLDPMREDTMVTENLIRKFWTGYQQLMGY